MRPLGDLNTHYWLVLGMAKASGADLAAAREDGRLSAEGWSALVNRCRECRWAERCQEWLPAQEAGRARLPDGCVNRAALGKLARA